MVFKAKNNIITKLLERLKDFECIKRKNVQFITLPVGTINDKEELVELFGGRKKSLPHISGRLHMDIILSGARLTVVLPFFKEYFEKPFEEVIAENLMYYTKNFTNPVLGFSICFIPKSKSVYSITKAFARIYIVR